MCNKVRRVLSPSGANDKPISTNTSTKAILPIVKMSKDMSNTEGEKTIFTGGESIILQNHLEEWKATEGKARSAVVMKAFAAAKELEVVRKMKHEEWNKRKRVSLKQANR